MTELTPEAIELRRAYNREYARKNREKTRQKQIDYWNRKAQKSGQMAETKTVHRRGLE